MMCGVGNFLRLLLHVFILAPVCFGLVYLGSLKLLNQLAFRKNKVVLYSVSALSGVVATLCVVSFLAFLQENESDTARHKHEIELGDVADKRNAEFWRKFSTLEQHLYTAKDDADLAVQQLNLFINKRDFGTVKIGPIHTDGRRELALEDRSVIESAPQPIKRRWYIGRGFLKGWPSITAFWVIKDGATEVAQDGDYCFAARRKADCVDITVYSKFPLDSSNYQYSVERYVKGCIGQEAYDRFLGTVAVLPQNRVPPNSNLNNDMQNTFAAALSAKERKNLDAMVTIEPCVVQISVLTKEKSTKFVQERNPFLKLRRFDTLQGCGGPY